MRFSFDSRVILSVGCFDFGRALEVSEIALEVGLGSPTGLAALKFGGCDDLFLELMLMHFSRVLDDAGFQMGETLRLCELVDSGPDVH